MNPRDAAIAAAGFGISVGHATNLAGATGCTVVRGTDAPLRASAHAFGRATGTRESLLLEPWASNDRVDAILLTGGSAYGLDAAAGIMRWMEERGRGYPIAGGVVPIVPAAVVFDLAPLGAFSARPTAQMAYDACDTASPRGWEEGSVGVGAGCVVGKVLGPNRGMKGGVGVGLAGVGLAGVGLAGVGLGGVGLAGVGLADVGLAGAPSGDERAAAQAACAVAAVNAVGHVRDERGVIIASARAADGTLVDCEVAAMTGAAALRAGANTTLAVVALNRTFRKVELQRVARSASSAIARRIGPAATSADGDVVFVVCPLDGPAGDAFTAEVAATAALEEAIVRAVRSAKGRDGIPGLAD